MLPPVTSLLYPAVPNETGILSPGVLASLIVGGMILVIAVLGCAVVWRKKSAGKRTFGALREEIAEDRVTDRAQLVLWGGGCTKPSSHTT